MNTELIVTRTPQRHESVDGVRGRVFASTAPCSSVHFKSRWRLMQRASPPASARARQSARKLSRSSIASPPGHCTEPTAKPPKPAAASPHRLLSSTPTDPPRSSVQVCNRRHLRHVHPEPGPRPAQPGLPPGQVQDGAQGHGLQLIAAKNIHI